MNFALDTSLRLQQKMSFNMIQSLKLLQVNTLELEQILQTELEQNPLLETDDDMSEDTDVDAEEERPIGDDSDNDNDTRDEADDYLQELTAGVDDEDGIDWEEYLEDGFDSVGAYREETDPNGDRYEPTAVYEETLEDRLLEQLSDKKVNERAKRLVRYLIACLDDDGYLRTDTGEIAARTGAAECEVADALTILHRLEPPGVGARNLRECLQLQLRAKGMDASLAMEILSKHWELFEKMKIPDIARLLEVEPRQVQEAIGLIAGLDPKPGHRYGADSSAAIVPDLIVKKIDGRFTVLLNDGTIPSLCINKRYAAMIKRGSKAKKEVKDYVREKFNSASWFIKAIEQRRATILRVMNAIVERQYVFFEQGPPNLVPLKQQEVADAIEMHISTVSRVVNDKYVQTQYGVFELKYFFTESVGAQRGAKKPEPALSTAGGDTTPSGGADVTAERIKNKIRQLIDGEDTAIPLSDQKIADLLGKDGLSVARRTVAKYREQMRVPTTRMRQTYG